MRFNRYYFYGLLVWALSPYMRNSNITLTLPRPPVALYSSIQVYIELSGYVIVLFIVKPTPRHSISTIQ